MVGCDCEVCTSADPRDNRLRCSVLVEGSGGLLLVDTTPDLRMQALRARLKRVEAVVLTHAHADHIMGFDDLRRLMPFHDQPLPIYGSRGTIETLQQAFSYLFNGQNRYRGYVYPEPHIVEEAFEVCGMTIKPLRVPHGKVETYGYRFDENGSPRFAYFCDCKCLPDEAVEAVRGVPVLVLDGLRQEPHPTHLSLPEAIETARRAEAKQTYFTHISHYLMHAREAVSLPEGMHFAYDTLSFEI